MRSHPINRAFVKRSPAFVDDARPSSALRELRAELARPAMLVLLGGIAGVLGLMGPFGTDALRPLPRLAYWGAIVGPTFAAGFLAHIVVRRRLSGRFGPMPRAAFGAGLSAIVNAALVVAINAAIFGHVPTRAETPGLILTTFGIALIVSIVFSVAFHETGPDGSPDAPALLARLPVEKRGALVALSAEDHYVRVRTTRGEELVLMRLSDAIGETHPVRGLKVHRSHWVALGQVIAVRRSGDRTRLAMAQGPEIPVSRGALQTLREAGLLPR
jgi:hypothetical protein